jgi:pimeloyl-ACP methyl ester carboxylesterase
LVTESAVVVGADRLAGIRTSPVGRSERGVVVLLSSGSEPHVGPGRAWVEYSRAFAVAGWGAIRMDFSGWGESPDHGHGPGRPYDQHTVGEADRFVAALRESGDHKIIVAGLCAGAWVALTTYGAADAIIAINPQLYWEPGDPVEALLSDTRKRREPIRTRDSAINRFGLWTLLDVMHLRPRAGRWLDKIAASNVPVLLLFAVGDDGIEYLQMRLGHRLRKILSKRRVILREIPDIDHPMHQEWRRGDVVEALVSFLDALDGEGRGATLGTPLGDDRGTTDRLDAATPRQGA